MSEDIPVKVFRGTPAQSPPIKRIEEKPQPAAEWEGVSYTVPSVKQPEIESDVQFYPSYTRPICLFLLVLSSGIGIYVTGSYTWNAINRAHAYVTDWRYPDIEIDADIFEE